MSGSPSESQLLSLISEGASEAAVGRKLCWNHFVSHSMFRAWMAKYGGSDAVLTARLRQLELENVRLKKTSVGPRGIFSGRARQTPPRQATHEVRIDPTKAAHWYGAVGPVSFA